MRRRDQHQEVHLAEAAQVQALAAGVGYGADLGEQAAGHAQLGRVDLEHLVQQIWAAAAAAAERQRGGQYSGTAEDGLMLLLLFVIATELIGLASFHLINVTYRFCVFLSFLF